MKDLLKHKLICFAICIAYLICVILATINNVNAILILPIILIIILLSIFNYKAIFYLIVLLTPFSMSLKDLGLSIGVEMAFPTEPLLFGLLFLSLIYMVYNFHLFKPLFKNSTFLLLLSYIFWMFITSITSVQPLVSFKMLLTRLWYIVPFFVMGVIIFKQKKDIIKFIFLYIFSFASIILYTIIRHSANFFDKHSAHFVMSPFFNDHTSYGAMIAFFIPLLIYLIFYFKHRKLIMFGLIPIILLFILGLVLSYTRAAWLSLFVSFVVVSILYFRINRKLLVSCFLISIFTLFLFQNPILQLLEENRQDSSDNLLEHVHSLSNISTDASNMERINRWKCALKMFIDKPVFGWGPGTYQFHYAPFQLYSDKTIISSNQGDMGNAHSEYLSVLSESGFVGLMLFLSLILKVFQSAISIYYRNLDWHTSILTLSLICALLTYFIHGIFNNFLDTDKASIPVWATMSMIISLEIFSTNKQIGKI